MHTIQENIARNAALEQAARILEDFVVNVNGRTGGESGALIPVNERMLSSRDVVRGTYADAIRALKVEV